MPGTRNVEREGEARNESELLESECFHGWCNYHLRKWRIHKTEVGGQGTAPPYPIRIAGASAKRPMAGRAGQSLARPFVALGIERGLEVSATEGEG